MVFEHTENMEKKIQQAGDLVKQAGLSEKDQVEVGQIKQKLEPQMAMTTENIDYSHLKTHEDVAKHIQAVQSIIREKTEKINSMSV